MMSELTCKGSMQNLGPCELFWRRHCPSIQAAREGSRPGLRDLAGGLERDRNSQKKIGKQRPYHWKRRCDAEWGRLPSNKGGKSWKIKGHRRVVEREVEKKPVATQSQLRRRTKE